MAKEKRTATTADWLRESLQQSGKKQADLARESGVDKGALSSYLSGKYEPKQKAIGKLAVALNVSEMWLWGYDVPMTRTAEQKKNDAVVDVVAKLRKDSDFLEVVSLLADLPAEQYASVKTLLTALSQK